MRITKKTKKGEIILWKVIAVLVITLAFMLLFWVIRKAITGTLK